MLKDVQYLLSSGAKGLNSVLLTLLHLDTGLRSLDNRDTLARVDVIGGYQVTTQVFHCFDLVSFSFDFYFKGLHSLLDCCTYLVKSRIDTCLSDTCIGRFLYC